ncbi:hypothetical protein Q7C36_009972 [Tachysurus vachellii]|uniref:Uncharacterized protein n=1 Tax=Tachysurus vachellii TaxID=175792 RepID=A0AA88N3I7_TACVA|nr:hypothetical protein Q7C36_009972 [Tachysurus vachellii]
MSVLMLSAPQLLNLSYLPLQCNDYSANQTGPTWTLLSPSEHEHGLKSEPYGLQPISLHLGPAARGTGTGNVQLAPSYSSDVLFHLYFHRGKRSA